MASITKYNKWLQNQINGTAPIDWDTDTIKVALLTSAYTPDAATHDFFDDVSANEVAGDGYTAGGATIANIAVVEVAGVTTVNGDDVTFLQEALGFTDARYAVIYKDSGVAATSPLMGYIDFLSDKGNVAGDLTIQWNVNGIFTAE